MNFSPLIGTPSRSPDNIMKLRCSKEKRGAPATFLILQSECNGQRQESTAIRLLQATVPSGKHYKDCRVNPMAVQAANAPDEKKAWRFSRPVRRQLPVQ